MTPSASKDLDAIVRRLRRIRLKLGPAATRVLDILADDPSWVLHRTSLDIAARARTSDATVIRTIQALGYSGLPDFREQVAAATRAEMSIADRLARAARDMRPGFAGAIEQAAEVNRLALSAIRADVASGTFGAAVDLIHGARRIVVLASLPWSGLQAHVRWSFEGLGFAVIERELDDLGQNGGRAPAHDPGDLLVALVLPPSSPAHSGVLLPEFRGDQPLLVISDMHVESRTPELVGLRVPCGMPGHPSLAAPVTTLVDTLMLGLLTCCPDETMRRAAKRSSECLGRSVEDEPSFTAG